MKRAVLQRDGMSIRGRVFFGLTVLVVTMATVLISTIWHNSYSQTRLYSLTDDYYETSNFMSAYLSANSTLETLVRSEATQDTNELYAQYSLYEAEMYQHINAIQCDVATVDTEWYLLVRAMKATLNSYAKLSDTLFATWSAGAPADAYALYYNTLLPCGGYLQQYSSTLLETEIRNGQNIYAQFSRDNLKFTIFQAALCVLVIAIGILYASFNVGFLRPVFDMIESAKKITAGNRLLPDIPYEKNNEMGQLVRAFNKMKNATGRLVEALQERNRMESQLAEARMREAEQEKLLQQALVLQLRSQINPHFLFNTLSTIARTARIEGAADSEKLIFALSRLFRSSLHAEDEGRGLLENEIAIVNEYMAIQRARFGERITLDWRIQPDVDTQSVYVPSFFLQPLVENAIIHGLENKVSGGLIRVRIRQEGDWLFVSVCDNGAGISQQALQSIMEEKLGRDRRFSGIGIRNVSARIRTLDSGNSFQVLSRQGRGTCVKMRIHILEWDGGKQE